MTTFTVNNGAELATALGSAQAGDRIELNAGGYANLTLQNLTFAAPVTITAAAGQAPELVDLKLTNVSGLTFDNLTFVSSGTLDGAPNSTSRVPAVKAQASDHLVFRDSEFRGSADGVHGNDGSGLEVISSSDITVAGNTFHDVRNGATFELIDGLSVTDNVAFDIRVDAFNLISTQNAEVLRNLAHSFHPQVSTDDHADLIQLFDRNTTPNANIVISENVLISPDVEVQGIFMRNDGGPRFSNITITENLIVTKSSNGIYTSAGTNIEISHNTLLGAFGATASPLVYVDHSTGAATSSVSIHHNIAKVEVEAGVAGPAPANNIVFQSTRPLDANYVGDYFLNPAGQGDINDFRWKPGVAPGAGATEPFTNYGAPVAYVTDAPHTDVLQLSKTVFSAVDWDGVVAPGTTYAWTFDDGVIMTGQTVAHRFATLGEHQVQVTIQAPGQPAVTIDKTVVVESPLKLHLTFNNDPSGTGAVVDSSPYARSAIWEKVIDGTADPASASYVSGPSGDAANFNGSDPTTGMAGIVVGKPSDLSGLNEMTIALDVRPDSLANGRILWLEKSFTVGITNGDLRVSLWVDDAPGTSVWKAAPIQAGVWQSVVIAFNCAATATEGSLKIYVDGTLAFQETSAAFFGDIDMVAEQLMIGRSASTYFDGAIDNVRVYSKALTPTEEAQALVAIQNPPPAGVSLSGDGVFEGVAAGVVVGDLSAVDPGDTATFALLPGSSPLFALNGAQVVVAAGASLDYETATSHTLQVRATDSAGNVVDRAVTVTIKNAVEFAAGGGTLSGSSGSDMVYGGAGSDYYVGDAGADTFSGGSGGFDVAVYTDAGAGIVVDLLNPAAGQGDAAGDVFINIDRIMGSKHSDALYGDNARNSLMGDQGADTLVGRGGNDDLSGGQGADLYIGGSGADTMRGGTGDTFQFSPGEAAGDVIQGFVGNGAAAGDTLVFQGYGAGATLSNVGDAWTITWAGGQETFTITGVTSLDPSDYVFA